MKPAFRAATAFGLLAALAAAAPAATPLPDRRRLSGERDEIVRRAPVPSPDSPQGEVRLVRRGDAVVMQTVLRTKVLRRVVSAIRGKEEALWPPGREGHEDSLRYLRALAAAAGKVRKGPAAGKDRRQQLLIEFILSPDAALVAFAEPAVEEEGEGRLRIVSRRPIAALPLSRRYVRRNLYEIAMDALILTRKEAARLLDPLLPPEPAPGSGEGRPARDGL